MSEAPSASDVVMIIPPAKLECSERRRCIKSGVVEQLFTGPELGKFQLTLASGGILATPVISYNHILPEYYLYSITVFLFVGFFSLLSATALRKTFPDPAAILGLIGTACVVIVIPTITAGVLPNHRVHVWLLFTLLLLTPILLVLLANFVGEGVDGNDRISDGATEIGVGKGLVEHSIASTEMKLEMPALKLGEEDNAQ